jgi:hypothetical protein
METRIPEGNNSVGGEAIDSGSGNADAKPENLAQQGHDEVS